VFYSSIIRRNTIFVISDDDSEVAMEIDAHASTSANVDANKTEAGENSKTPPPKKTPKKHHTHLQKKGTGTQSSHIHLWQFLKELLSAPQTHGTAIRWLDRSKGIFKIEDSVRVARLWGRRKNRPAMNYDKLSRSIRQYYKKGIMKKTERSQRLVYQFCHPYCL
jgi:SAM pointed domain-containing ETS transcription factor